MPYTSVGGRKESEKAAPKEMTAEQREKLLDSIGKMPVENRVAALRAAGLVDEANEYEQHLAEEHLRKIEEERRSKRLAEIMAMEETEQLALLIAEGYEDEAAALSEKLSANMGQQSDGANGAENDDNEAVNDDASVGHVETAAKDVEKVAADTTSKKASSKKGEDKETK